jgi:hypothetical protein
MYERYFIYKLNKTVFFEKKNGYRFKIYCEQRTENVIL